MIYYLANIEVKVSFILLLDVKVKAWLLQDLRVNPAGLVRLPLPCLPLVVR
jgi:hypothetical protein